MRRELVQPGVYQQLLYRYLPNAGIGCVEQLVGPGRAAGQQRSRPIAWE